MNGKFVALAAVGMMLAGQAMAADAQITSVNGSVVASQNGKFSPAAASTAVRQGDRIVARDGTAQVRFADGCVVTLKPQAMLTVGEASPCASGSGLISATQGDSAQFGRSESGFVPAAITFTILAALLLLIGNSQNDDTISD